MRNVSMSKIQKQIYDYVKKSINDRGYPPAVREIGDIVNLKSTSSVHSHLKKLEDMGYIRRDPTKPRTIEIMEDCFNLKQRNVKVPLLRTVTAGQSLYAEQNIEEYWTLPIETINYKESFMLNVKGNSMVNANIIDGDMIIVNVDSTADNGEIVVAVIDGSATVKRFFKEDGYYRLQPENDSMSPIIVNHVEILGKVIGVLRLGIH